MAAEISPAEVWERMQSGPPDFVLLDCREPEELAIARIEGAVHMPMGDIPSFLPRLDPDREYVVFCHHGLRSQQVADFLRQQDFARVQSMTGGIDAWSCAVDPGVARY